MNIDRSAAPISVIIPCYRCASTIWRAVDSVFAQSLSPFEVILVEDCSGDETLGVLQSLQRNFPGRIKIVKIDQNQGAASARNAGWAIASQPYIAFLDADDTWHPKKLEIQYAYMRAHPEVVLCAHAHREIKQNDVQNDWKLGDWKEERIHKRMLLLVNYFITPSVMLHRDVNHRFAIGQRHMEDRLLWLELVCDGGVIVKLSAELAAIYKSTFGASGLSAQMWSMGKYDLSNYVRLYSRGYINFIDWISLSFFSLLKFARRLVIYWGYLRWKN